MYSLKMKKYILNALALIVAYVILIIQAYYSNIELKFTNSAYCINCSMLSEILFNSIVFVIFVVVLLVAKRLRFLNQVIVLTVFFFITCFVINDSIMSSRIYSWSTFTTSESLSHSFYSSWQYITVATFIFILSYIYTFKKEEGK